MGPRLREDDGLYLSPAQPDSIVATLSRTPVVWHTSGLL